MWKRLAILVMALVILVACSDKKDEADAAPADDTSDGAVLPVDATAVDAAADATPADVAADGDVALAGEVTLASDVTVTD